MFDLGWPELLLIFGVLLLFFGATRLPQMGRAIGTSIKEFRKGFKDDATSDAKDEPAKAATKPSSNGKEISQH